MISIQKQAEKLQRDVDHLLKAVKAAAKNAPKKKSGVYPRCFAPRCKNTASPRHGMFCAAVHKDLPASRKAKFRAARLKNAS